MTLPAEPDADCTLCGSPAVGRFWLDRGCIARRWPENQDLCLQHLHSAEPLGSFELVEDYTAEQLLTAPA